MISQEQEKESSSMNITPLPLVSAWPNWSQKPLISRIRNPSLGDKVVWPLMGDWANHGLGLWDGCPEGNRNCSLSFIYSEYKSLRARSNARSWGHPAEPARHGPSWSSQLINEAIAAKFREVWFTTVATQKNPSTTQGVLSCPDPIQTERRENKAGGGKQQCLNPWSCLKN